MQSKKASDIASTSNKISNNNLDDLSNNCSEFKDMSCEISGFHTNMTNDMVSESGTELNMLMKGLPYQSGIFSQSPAKQYQYHNYDFGYRRTAFRSMTDYLKDAFGPILKKWKEGDRKSTKSFVQDFISEKVFAQQQLLKHSDSY